LFNTTILAQVIVNGLSLGAIYVLIALGFTLLFGIMRVVNFAHGAFAMLGGYALYYLYDVYHLPYLIAVFAAPAAVAILCVVFERSVFRWFYGRMFQSMIGLLGLEMVLVFSAVLIWDTHERSVRSPIDSVIEFGDVFLTADKLIVMGVAAVTLVSFWALINYTKIGLAMRAAAQDGEIAETQGINTSRVYLCAFVVAIFLTALAGGLYAQTYALSPFVGERILMVAFVVVILGGMGSIPGAALGGLILGLVESFLSTFVGSSAAAFTTFGAVILLLIFRPWGLLGQPE